MNWSDRTEGRRLISAFFRLTTLAVFSGAVASVFAETATVSVEVEFAERIHVTPVTMPRGLAGDARAAPAGVAIIGPGVRGDDTVVAAFRVAMAPRRLMTVTVDAVSTTGPQAGLRCSYGALPVTSCDAGSDLISEADGEFRIATAGGRDLNRASVEVMIAYQ